MKLGGSDILALRLGSDNIVAAFLGATQVWPTGFYFSGALEAESEFAGSLSARRPMSSSLSAHSAGLGALGVLRPLSGALLAGSAFSGDLGVFDDVIFSGDMTVSSALSGAASVKRGVSGSMAALAALAGQPSIERGLGGAIAAIAAFSGAVRRKRGIAGAMAANAAFSGALTVESSGIEISAWLNGERAAGAASSAVSFASLSPATGDYLLYIAAADSADGASSVMAPSGYTAVYETTDSNPNGGVWYKKLGAAETSITLPAVASLGTAHVYTMAVLKGVHATTPMDATRTTASGGTGDPDCPSITTATADAMVVAIGLIDDDTVTSVSAYPSGYTNTGFNGGTGASIVVSAKVVASPGAENPSAYATSADDAWWAITVAFRPA
jgi:hypothetical protein